jgi:short-subunit dehydrogenase
VSSGAWVITGASRGIGRAIAMALASPERPLVLTATRTEHLDPVIAALRGKGCSARAAAVDLSKPGGAATLVPILGEGPVAGLINNAGVLERGKLEALTPAQIERVMRVNVIGLIEVTQVVLPRLAKGGRIINIGSISGTMGSPEASIYNASKWALTGLTRSWAEELRERGILVAEVRPGSVDTDMLAQTPFSPQVKAEEVARVVTFLATEAPMATTGTSIDVFG